MKTTLVQELTDPFNNFGPQKDILVDLLSSKVKEAIGQTGRLWGLIIFSHLERKNISSRKNLKVLTVQLDLTGWDLAVHHRIIALHYLAGDFNNRLNTDVLNLCPACLIKYNLGLSVVISEIYEYNTTVITLSKDPARKGHSSSGV
jgi:hypothetical protein